ncbi:hypothetical protein [Alteromonas macleodii]
MNSYLPNWLTDIASIVSIIGFIVTCFLLVEARKIRNSFMRKARIPEIVNDLDRISGDLIANLKQYDNESRSAHEKIQKATALLESILPKIPDSQKEKVQSFIDGTNEAISNTLNEDSSWNVSTELSGVVTYLQQIAKDTRWD